MNSSEQDPSALARFIEEHRPQLLAYIENRLGSALRQKVEPQDILQEVSIQALRPAPEGGRAQADPFGWLCQAAEQRIVDAHRRFFGAQKRSADREVSLHTPVEGESGLIDLLAASATTPSQALSRDMRYARLQAALATLPEEAQRALQLRYVSGLPSKEIARQLGKSDGAVRILLTRSLRRLQELLGPQEGR